MLSQANIDSNLFKDTQRVFTKYIRDPDSMPAPEGIEARRLKIYTDLVFHNIEGFIANSFPVLRHITPDDIWHAMLRDYLSRHISHTPYFTKMPLEFLNYLESERNSPRDPDFYFELAHYEWIESQLMLDQRHISFDGVDRDGHLLTGTPVISPLVAPLTYQWPVHRIRPDYLPKEKPEQETYLLVYRNCDHDVGFLELNPVSAKLVEILLHENRGNGKDILLSIASQLNHSNPDVVLKGGLEILSDFFERDIIIGTKK